MVCIDSLVSTMRKNGRRERAISSGRRPFSLPVRVPRTFRSADRLYEEFLKPILLVGLFAPPEELSAGVVLGMLYFYVLAHQPDFDVR